MGETQRVLSGVGLDEAFLALAISEHTRDTVPRFEKLWTYYRNSLSPSVTSSPARWYSLGQEIGLPRRGFGRLPEGALPDDRSRPAVEAVVENDIAWRIQSMIDFMFGKPIHIASTSQNESAARAISLALDAAWEASGGIALLQDIALLGHVFGHVDLVVSADEDGLRAAARSGGDPASRAVRAAAHLRVEAIDPRRGIPILDPDDYRRILAYIVHLDRGINATAPSAQSRARRTITQILTPSLWRTADGDRITGNRHLQWTHATPPVVHIQNISEPFSYSGIGEVEPLIPLQDELNARLSDRAARVTLQSFKMYLAKGIDGFDKHPVAPGQIWSTDNPDASISSFGGDSDNPSEDAHIAQIREAMDKISGVPPVAGGVVQGKIGSLSSANALRVTLLSVLAKTARKRVTYGRGIIQASQLMLQALRFFGVLDLTENDTGLRIDWPDPVPVDERERILTAEAKIRAGVPESRVLGELGYSSDNPGIQ